MKSSGNSSAPSQRNSLPVALSRKRFALTGPSRPFDPRTTAARPDLADVRVADRVFAPHYAAALPRTVVADGLVSDARNGDPIGAVAMGDVFEVLECTAAHAWGVAPDGIVGYVPLAILATS